jgi:hypothetical protein
VGRSASKRRRRKVQYTIVISYTTHFIKFLLNIHTNVQAHTLHKSPTYISKKLGYLYGKNVYASGRPPAEIVGSYPAWDMDVCLL